MYHLAIFTLDIFVGTSLVAANANRSLTLCSWSTGSQLPWKSKLENKFFFTIRGVSGNLIGQKEKDFSLLHVCFTYMYHAQCMNNVKLI